ncbi:hypothetical protein HDU92_007854 [Lobulomyces angularis]|nr:hypothetical protein HDU92_007854 [Lobulomyces angularis]
MEPSTSVKENLLKVRSGNLVPDHRTIGTQLKLFKFNDLSPGAPFFLPHGVRILNKLMSVLRNEYKTLNINEVVSPLVFNKKLWEKSGHWENYSDDMFAVGDIENPAVKLLKGEKVLEEKKEANDSEQYGLKPMNCPGHCPLHRNEASGALTGLTRVKKFHQDDAHIFCTKNQIKDEIQLTLNLVNWVYKTLFKFPSYSLSLSTKPEQGYLGSSVEYEEAEEILKTVLEKEKEVNNTDWSIKEGDGAFYGPKIDISVKDALNRSHQLATIQLDFQLPSRFELTYQAEDGSLKRPVMIHRAILGSMERMIAILTENYNGKFPFWLSPRQAIVISTNKNNNDYALKVSEFLNGKDRSRRNKKTFFVDTDLSDKLLGKKVREAIILHYNFVIVAGDREREGNYLFIKNRDIINDKGQKMDLIQVLELFERYDEQFL